MRRTSRSHRRGYTMVECLAVVTLTTIVLHGSIMFLMSLSRWGEQASTGPLRADACDRLEQSLRVELQQSTKVSVDGSLLTIATPAGTSNWQLVGDACQLKATRDTQNQFDRFAIGPYTTWQWSESPTTRELTIADSAEPSLPVVRIVVPAVSDEATAAAEEAQP
ncbi:hypothetical protein [Aeoliella mucimassa]|uniref:Prepilin-type N-terminal cleavage/methylation domain-containing protein n=1 Tax=Aeoliella mucimassa TaxID=2527972 RepID=A0A518AH59_9BACT|nr:hypothetical protein [Aeoliella mucimassa]QDU54063.1 hypothetical protein Pan181_02430 [Aeoliella mucimassa]